MEGKYNLSWAQIKELKKEKRIKTAVCHHCHKQTYHIRKTVGGYWQCTSCLTVFMGRIKL